MCDPVTLTAVALTAAGTASNAIAGSNARKSAQKTMNANTARQAASFDQRMDLARGSDKRVMGLEQGEYKDASMLEDGTFSYLLAQSKEHADANALADKGLVTAQRQLQNQRIQSKTLESARQSGFLEKMTGDVADAVRAAMPGSQAAMTTANFANRIKVLSASLDAKPEGGGFTMRADDLVKQAYAASADTARTTAMDEGAAGARVGGALDSASWADQLMGQAGQRADLVKGRAALSKDQNDGELATIDASDELAQQHASFAKSLNDWQQQQRVGAYTDWAGKEAGAQTDFYGRSKQSENDYTTGMIGANQHADDVNTQLANYKIQNTQADTTFGDLLKTAGSAVAMAGAVSKMPTFSAMLKPNNMAMVSSKVMRSANPAAAMTGFG